MVCASLAFIDGLGGPEMVLIFVIVLVLFGGQKLPEFARGLGKSIREFKKAAAGVEEEFKRALEEDERKNATPKLTAAPTEPAPVTDEYMDPMHDHGGPDAGVHSPASDDESHPPMDDVPADESVPTVSDAPEHHHADEAPEPEPKILPPAPAPTPPPAPPPKSSPVPPATSFPENPS